MSVYLILARGFRADDAIPILASSDPQVVDAALQAIARLDAAELDKVRTSGDCTTTQPVEEGSDELRS